MVMKYLDSVDEIFKVSSDLQKKYDFLHSEVIGESLCGRKIEGLKIGTKENMTLFACAFHGMEWITSLVILKFLDTICGRIYNNEPLFGVDVSGCLERKGIYVVPCVNPDGVEISLNGRGAAKKFEDIIEKVSFGKTFDWQANARGVDINHNFDADWERLHELERLNSILGPSKTRYGGKYPESEPETRALTKLCGNTNFDYVVAFHSQGEEIYWDYGEFVPKNSEKFADIFALTSGYKLSSPQGLACGGGFKDWFIKKYNRPAFTIEMGKGKNPISLCEVDNIYQKIEKMLVLMVIL